ncbi:MAG: TIGR01212 family radical SAM protein [Lachnospiraceae bacterium]|nr:TIGR01212 family radical SAM protein [Lachnospiraceae bacterium]
MYINDLSSYLKQKFGHKVYKLALNGKMTCPNRDGTKGNRGCIFCSEGGSGEFAADGNKTIFEQIEEAKRLVHNKLSDGHYIAYFQAYTNTYASVDYLRKIFTEAINHPDIEVLSVATRPDCLNQENIKLLAELNWIKPVWVEMGLQTVNEESIKFIRRGYENKVFENATESLISYGIDVIVHMIIGLPEEGIKEILNTVRYINRFKIQGVKFQLLHVLKGTDLEQYYYERGFHIYSMEEYADILFEAVEHLRKDIVIHRLTGDGPKKLLIAPLWSGNKRKVMNYIRDEMKRREIIQGTKMIQGTEMIQGTKMKQEV